MTLNEKQVEFSRTLARFLCWCFDNDYLVIVAEVYRTPYQARRYAEIGKGIVNSVHTKKLAADLFRYKNGVVTWDSEDYVAMGDKWKSMHPLARWGGDFQRRDAVHFSFIHNGVC